MLTTTHQQVQPAVVAVLSMLTRQDTSAATIRKSMTRTEYERAYIEAQRLYTDNHIVDNGKVVQHPPKWIRRVR